MKFSTILLLTILLFLLGCNRQQPAQRVSKTEITPSPDAGWLLYTIADEGFRVALPASWKQINMEPDKIEVVIHPQSVIHSLVQFTDGSIKAQLGLPDMRLPIQYALGYPNRVPSEFPPFSFAGCREFTFEEPDRSLFRNLQLAYSALRAGGNMPCIMNAANEIVVEAFLRDRVKFLNMPGIIEETMGKIAFIREPGLEDFEVTDREARVLAREIVGRKR